MPRSPKQQDEQVNIADMIRNMSEKIKLQATRPNLHGYVPHDKQVKFHESQKRNRLYIGGNRSGKTTGGIIEDLWWATGKHPYRKVPEGGVRGRVVAVDFIQGIEKIILPEIKRWCPPSAFKYNSWEDSYDKQERTLNFANGSFIEFMSYDQKLDKFAGTSRHFIHFDEEPPQDIYTECCLRLLDTKGSWWMTLTPVQGMQWMYDEIYMKGLTDPNSRIDVIQVDTYENPHLDAEEIDEVLAAIVEDDRDARIKGKFIRRGGLVYKNFERSVHVVEPLEKVPSNWELYASLDHGYNNPTAWYWHGVDPDGNVVTFAEHYEAEMVVADHAEMVKAINSSYGRDPGMYIGDPAISQRSGVTGASIQSEYALHGIYINLANNEVLNGINKVNTYLRHDDTHRPRWTITSNCVNLINEIQRYRWKTWANKQSERQNNKYDVAHKKDDHAMDSIRYFFTIMPDLTPIKKFEPSVASLPKMGNDGVMPGIERYDELLSRVELVKTDWSIESQEEYMGGEW